MLCTAGGAKCSKTTQVDDLISSFTLVNENNGTGWADGVISQINLTAGSYYEFEAVWHNDTDGMEQFWIIPGSTSVPAPEPGTLSMLAVGLLGFVAISLRKPSAA